MDPYLKKLIAFAGEAVGAKDVIPGGDLSIRIGYTVWRECKPGSGIYTYSSSVDMEEGTKSVKEYLDELRKLKLPPNSKDGYAEKFWCKLEHQIQKGPVRVPFLVFSKGNAVVPNVEESGFELKDVPWASLPSTALDLSPVEATSKYYLGFPGCPVQFNLQNDEGFGEDKSVAMFDLKFGYPNLLFSVGKQSMGVLKAMILALLDLEATHKDLSIQEIVQQERIFIAPRKLYDWGIPITPTLGPSQPGDIGVLDTRSLQWGYSTGWNVTRTLTR